MKHSVALLCASTLLLLPESIDARKRLINNHDQVLKGTHHNVRECKKKCVFRNDDNHWCFETATPYFQMGWSYDQEYGENEDADPLSYFTWQLLPYVQFYFSITSDFSVPRAYMNNLNFELAQFKMNFFIANTFNWNYQICSGVGTEHEEIDATMTMISNFMTCKKKLIYDFCETYNIWRGSEAKYFEGCEDTDILNAEFTTWEYKEARVDRIFKGTLAPDSPYSCHNLPLIGKGDSAQTLYAKQSYKRIGQYYLKNYYEKRDEKKTHQYGRMSNFMKMFSALY